MRRPYAKHPARPDSTGLNSYSPPARGQASREWWWGLQGLARRSRFPAPSFRPWAGIHASRRRAGARCPV